MHSATSSSGKGVSGRPVGLEEGGRPPLLPQGTPVWAHTFEKGVLGKPVEGAGAEQRAAGAGMEGRALHSSTTHETPTRVGTKQD
jgi:hypothetical protein